MENHNNTDKKIVFTETNGKLEKHNNKKKK